MDEPIVENEQDESRLHEDSEDLALPRQTVAKLVQELMPDGFLCPKDTRDLLVACCTEFVHLITSEANEVCEKAGKKTISPDHLMEALRNLGFAEYCQEMEQALQEQQEAAKQRLERSKRSNPVVNSAVSEDELAKQQAELFEQARLKYLNMKKDEQ